MLPGKTAIRAGSMRIAYMQLDAMGRTGKDNPLTNQKVRQAICHAVDRQAIAHDLMQGNSLRSTRPATRRNSAATHRPRWTTPTIRSWPSSC